MKWNYYSNPIVMAALFSLLGHSSVFADNVRVWFIDSGQGNCALVTFPTSPALLVDCGEVKGQGSMTKEQVAALVYSEWITSGNNMPMNVIVSHPDKDHYNLVATALGKIPVGNILLGGKSSAYKNDGKFLDWLTAQKKKGTKIYHGMDPNSHETLDFLTPKKDVTLTMLTVNTPPADGATAKNANSLVLNVSYGKQSVTFAGDAAGSTQRQAAINEPDVTRSTTILAGSHHGASSHLSNDAAWAEAVQPDYVVYMAGFDGQFGHPRCNGTYSYFPSITNKSTPHQFWCYDGQRDPTPIVGQRANDPIVAGLYSTNINTNLLFYWDDQADIPAIECHDPRVPRVVKVDCTTYH